MKISTYLIKRIIQSIFILIGLSILIFFIARVVPGDPARIALGSRAPQEVIEEWNQFMKLDRPIYVQYYFWLKNVFRGDFGQSLYTRRNVFIDIKTFLPATIELILFSGLIMEVFAIFFGVLSGKFNGKLLDNIIRVSSYIAVATPSFLVAIILLLIFGYHLNILPTLGRVSDSIIIPPTITGMITLDSLLTGNFEAFIDAIKHLLMPGVALALGGMAQEIRITRSSIVNNLQKDYVAVEKAQGFPENIIYFKYLLKTSLIPTVSIAGLDFASMLGNAFLVELIFNWPGISQYGVQAMLFKDLNAIVAVVMIIGILYITVNIIVDIIVAYLDPRIRLN